MSVTIELPKPKKTLLHDKTQSGFDTLDEDPDKIYAQNKLKWGN